MGMDKEYFAFISYQRQNEEWAVWLREELEHYHLPASFSGSTDVRDNLVRCFATEKNLVMDQNWMNKGTKL